MFTMIECKGVDHRSSCTSLLRYNRSHDLVFREDERDIYWEGRRRKQCCTYDLSRLGKYAVLVYALVLVAATNIIYKNNPHITIMHLLKFLWPSNKMFIKISIVLYLCTIKKSTRISIVEYHAF